MFRSLCLSFNTAFQNSAATLEILLCAFSDVKNRFRNNPRQLVSLLWQYLTGERAFRLDLFTIIKSRGYDFEKQPAKFIMKNLYPVDFILKEIKAPNTSKQVVFKSFELIRNRNYRIHTSYFSDTEFCSLFSDYLLSKDNHSCKVSDIKTETVHIPVFNLIADHLFQKGWILEEMPPFIDTNKIFIDTNKIGEGVLSIATIHQEKCTFEHLQAATEFRFQDPVDFEGDKDLPSHVVNLLKVECCEVDSVVIYPGGQIVKDHKLIIYDESANPLKRKFIAGLQGKVLAFFGGKAVYCSFRYRKTYSFDEAILFFSRCSANYFHWMIEYLPRLKIIADLKKTDIPALVPKRLAPQQLEAIKYLAGELNLKLVYVENESRILVKRLHIPMPLTFHPDDPDVPFWIGAGLPAEHIKFFRDSLLKAMKLPSQAKKTRKLFLARRGAFRNITNIKSIEAVVAEEGFEIFYPETSSLKEQAEILMQAQVIVAPCGSALTNIIFMSPGAKVISLIGQHNASYSMYANLAGVVGVEYLHVTGVSQHPREYYSTDLAYIHASFSVSPEKLRRAIQSLSTQ